MMIKPKQVPDWLPSDAPRVYGYLRAEDPDEIELSALRKEIGLFCQEHGYRLETVIIDRYATDDMVVRAGFTGLLDVLQLDSSHGVVVPDLGHLSGNNHALALIQRLIRRTASRLIVIHESADEFKADGA